MAAVPKLRLSAAIVALTLAIPCVLQAQETTLPTKDIIDQLSIDLDQDGILDRLFLIRADGFADLAAFKGVKDAATGNERFVALPVAKEFAFGKPWFDAKAKGVLTVGSAQSQGRYKWEQMLTLAWRGGKLRVIGITYAVNDSISNAFRVRNCDLNLSTGKGVANGKPVKVTLKPLPVEQWSDSKLPSYCFFG